MTTAEKFAKAQSPLAKKSKYVRLILHFLSIPFTTWGLVESYGSSLQVSGVTIIWIAVAALAIALCVQYAIASQESSVARQIVWWAFPNAGSVAVWGASVVFLSSLVWFNHQTSQAGRIGGVDKIVGEAQLVGASDLDSTREKERATAWSDFRTDSLSIVQSLSMQLKANSGIEQSALIPVGAMRRKAASVKASHPSWSAGIYQNATQAETAAKAERQQADAEAQRDAAKKMDESRQYAKGLIAGSDSVFASALLVRTMEDGSRRASHNSVKQVAQSGGFWLVILSSLGSIFICLLWEAYRRICGLEMEGQVFDPRTGKSELLSNVNGLFGDVVDGINIRFGKTREAYQNEIKTRGAYEFPRSSVIMRAASLLGAGYIGYTNYSPTLSVVETTNAQMSHVEAGSILVLIVLFIGSYWKDKWNPKTRQSEPVADNTETVPTLVAELSEKVPETLVRQQIQVVAEEEDSTVEILSPDEIRRAKDRCRKYYERQFTSATRTGQASNADKYREQRKELQGCGYRVTASGPNEKRNVKIEGKAQVVTYKRLIISE